MCRITIIIRPFSYASGELREKLMKDTVRSSVSKITLLCNFIQIVFQCTQLVEHVESRGGYVGRRVAE